MTNIGENVGNLCGVVVEHKKRKQLKSSLEGFYKLVNDGREFMKDVHFGLITQTPFAAIFWGFFDGKLSLKELRRYEIDLWKIIACYNKNKNKFVFGSNELELKKKDISKVFGITQKDVVNDELLLPPAEIAKDFFAKYFNGIDRPTGRHIHDAFLDAIQDEDPLSAEEAVSLMTMHLCATLFYPNTSGTIPRYIAKRCMSLETVNKFDWAKDIAAVLDEQLSSKGANEACVNGCVMALLYWFCDIANVIEPIKRNQNESASFLKWNLGELHFNLENMDLQEINLHSNLGSPAANTTHAPVTRSPNLKAAPTSDMNPLVNTIPSTTITPVVAASEGSSSRSPFMQDGSSPNMTNAPSPTMLPPSHHGLSHHQQVMSQLHKERSVNEEKQRILDGKNAEIRYLLEQKKKGEEEVRKLTDLLDSSAFEIIELKAEIEALKTVIGQQKMEEAAGNGAPKENIVNDKVMDEQDIPSMIKKIKQRGSRKKVDFSKRDIPITTIVPSIVIDSVPLSYSPIPPPKKQRNGKEKVVDLEDVVERKKKIGITSSLGRLKNTKVWKHELNVEDKEKLELFWKNTTEGDALWENEEDSIGTMEIDHILRCTTITCNVINCYLAIISQEEKHKKSLFMSTLAWECVRRKEENGIKHQLFEPLLDAWGSVDKIYIPIALEKEMHIVLLVVDKNSETATIYDTLQRLNTSSANYATVKKMVEAIEGVLRAWKLNSGAWIKSNQRTTTTIRGKEKTEQLTPRMLKTLIHLKDKKPHIKYTIAENCPLQPGRSLDCGIAVLKIIETLSAGKEVRMMASKEFIDNMTEMRGKLLHTFINHNLSWSFGNPRTDVRVDPMIAEISTQINKSFGKRKRI